MNFFICPVCSQPIIDHGESFKCANGHCFDKSAGGYVNLLISSGKKNHGDDKLMVTARRNFLSKGYYSPLLSVICRRVAEHSHNNAVILDSGCGEGWYSRGVFSHLIEAGIYPEMFAIDVSKHALKFAAKSCPEISFAVASAYKLPLADLSCDIVTSFFAPLALDEFKRVLKENAVFITAIPLERHLWGLKEAAYDKPYLNKPESEQPEGFELLSSDDVKTFINLDNAEDIQNLFMMTPYYYKTSAHDQEKLKKLTALSTELEFRVLTYRKK